MLACTSICRAVKFCRTLSYLAERIHRLLHIRQIDCPLCNSNFHRIVDDALDTHKDFHVVDQQQRSTYHPRSVIVTATVRDAQSFQMSTRLSSLICFEVVADLRARHLSFFYIRVVEDS